MYKHLYECFKHWQARGSLYFYSDPHFGDLITYSLRFPKEFEEEKQRQESNFTPHLENGSMVILNYDFTEWVSRLDEMQVKRINSIVHKHDTIIFLGDVGNLEFIKKIRGYKVLLLGNHDKGASNYKREIVSTSKVLCWRVEFNGIRPPICLHEEITIEDAEGKFGNVKDIITVYEQEDNHLFDEVYEGPLMISNKILLSHEPVKYDFALNIHGHDHSERTLTNLLDYMKLNVCAEHINYIPISLKSIVEAGRLKAIPNIHRETIDKAVYNKKKIV